MVNVLRHGQVVRMGKRAGNFVTLGEVLDEVGVDATRWFLISRSADAMMEFDLDLAAKQSSENPVYYVQYAHARLSRVLVERGRRRLALGRRVAADPAGRAGADPAHAAVA